MVKVRCDTQKLTEQVFDILVIDDGITGAWTALGTKFTTDYRLKGDGNTVSRGKARQADTTQSTGTNRTGLLTSPGHSRKSQGSVSIKVYRPRVQWQPEEGCL
jgi:hypothetical protein